MAHVIGRNRTARETYPEPPRASGSGALIQIGFDGVQENVGQYAVNTWEDVLRAAATRLAVPLPGFVAGNVLLVAWSITAVDGSGEPSSGVQIQVAPTVDAGSGEEGVYLGGNFVSTFSTGPGGSPTAASTTGFAAIRLNSVTNPVVSRLRIIVSGDVALIQPAQGWMLAAEFSAGGVPFVPPSSLGPNPT